jgi:hypothetical protein
MDILALLVALMIGVILGFGLQHPALLERQREVRLTLRHARTLLADADMKMEIAHDKLRLVQAVRAQTSQMIDDLEKAPVLERRSALSEPSPIFESMHGWLASTGAMPIVEPTVEPVKPKAKRKVSVKVGPDVRSELIEMPS